MGEIRATRPSPAIVVAALALVAALAGTAVAGPDATTSAISKKKVKKIAKKQINKLAPGLSVAEAANAAALGGRPPSAYASSASEPYREVGTPGQPSFQNGWGNLGGSSSSAAFYKDPLGVVHLKGSVDSTVNESTIFTLPAGYRPTQVLVIEATGLGISGASAGILVRPNGTVQGECLSPGACELSIDGLTFRAG